MSQKNLPNLLIVDNDPDFLDDMQAFFADAFRVLTADSVEAANQALADEYIHLMICDIRLVDDGDINDRSGVQFFTDPKLLDIPKIAVSAYKDPESAQQLIGKAEGFESKADDPEIMVNNIKATSQRVNQLNWHLTITSLRSSHPVTPYRIAESLSPLPQNPTQRDQEEIVALLRGAFKDYDEIILAQVIWKAHPRLAVWIWCKARGVAAKGRVLILGNRQFVEQERKNFSKYCHSGNRYNTTLGHESSHTTRLACHTYELSDFVSDRAPSMKMLFPYGSKEWVERIVENLCNHTLKSWYTGEGSQQTEQGDICQWFEDRIGRVQKLRSSLDSGSLGKHVQRLFRELRPFGQFNIDEAGFSLKLKGTDYQWANPFQVRHAMQQSPRIVTFANTLGLCLSESIMLDGRAHTWVTDFGDVGMGPALRDYVALEAILRYEWAPNENISTYLELEKKLTLSDFLLEDIDIESVPEPSRAAFAGIRKVREYAKDVVDNEEDYHLAMMYHLLARMLLWTPGIEVFPGSASRLIQQLAALGMVCDRLANPTQSKRKTAVATKKVIWEPERNRFLVGDKEIKLRGNNLTIVHRLAEEPGKVVPTAVLMGALWPDKTCGETEKNNLKSYITKLRGKAEEISFINEDNGYKIVF